MSFSLLTVILLILFYKMKFTLKTERKRKVQWVIYPLYIFQFQNNLLNAMFSYLKIKIIIL